MTESKTPTQEVYAELQTVYDHFNAALFGGELPACLLTLQRQKRTFGYFCRRRFVNTDGRQVDEIALNPAYFASHGLLETLQTIGHEMTHLWQDHFGEPGRGRYHNKEWAEKMEAIGLMPSHNGKPGGRKTGDHMADYVIEGGTFDKACQFLLSTEFRISWMDRFPDTSSGATTALTAELIENLGLIVPNPGTAPTAQPTRLKFSHHCPDQGPVNLWGKPSLNVVCGDCGQPFAAA